MIVAWTMVCFLTSEAGLGIKSIHTINNVVMLRLGWEMYPLMFLGLLSFEQGL